MRTLFLLLICICFSNCTTSVVKKESGDFFDLKVYFKNQIEVLTKNQIAVEKNINKNGEMEKKSFAVIDWQKELRPFIEADINKPAWKDSYIADTTLSDGVMTVKYAAMEKKLSVREVKISFESDTVSEINISIEKKNSYYTAKQELIYKPGKGYSISGVQQVILGDSISYSIHTAFIY